MPCIVPSGDDSCDRPCRHGNARQDCAPPQLPPAFVSGEVIDLDTHKVLWRRNGDMLMEAASTTKLLTNGTSLALLGPNYRITTPVYADGTIDATGTLHGDLRLVAKGDTN